VTHLFRDLRHAVRALAAHPWITTVAVVTLAVGISVNTVVFSVVNGLLLKGPAPGAVRVDRLARPFTGSRTYAYGETSYADFRDLAAETSTLDLAAEGFLPLGAIVDGRPAQVWTLLVSANYFSVLQTAPAVGRLFGAQDAVSGEPVAVVSHVYWRRWLDATTDLTDRFVVLNGRSCAVVGVLPEDFKGPGGIYVPDVWVPLTAIADLGLPAGRTGRSDRWLRMVGRLRDGVSLEQAQVEFAALVERLGTSYPEDEGRVGTVTRLTPGYPDEYRAMQAASALALGATGLVLLIACFNVASLVLARAVDRQRELGIRASLGATRARLVGQLVTENLVLAALAGVMGLLVSIWSRGALSTFAIPAPIPQAINLAPDGRTLWYVAGLVLVAGLVPGVLPALHASRLDPVQALKAGGLAGSAVARRTGLRNAFLVLQMTGSTAFLVLAALFVQSYVKSASADLGFDAAHTVVLRVNPELRGYEGARAGALLDALEERVAAIPGVEAAAQTNWAPYSIGGAAGRVLVSADGRDCAPGACTPAVEVGAGPGLAAALGVAITDGRDLRPGDRGAPHVVVSRALAAALWPNRNPVGETFFAGTERRSWLVVGVAADVSNAGLGRPSRPLFYRPLEGSDTGTGSQIWIVARANGDPVALIDPIRDAVAEVDRTLPLASLETMEENLRLPLWQGRVLVAFFGLCGAVALVFATVGLAGVTHYVVEQRTKEFGVRLALGATARQLMTAVVGDGVRLAAAGTLLGLVAAWAAARLLAAGLTGISPADPLTYGAIAGLQALVAILAGLVPAIRATLVDPVLALRAE